MVIYALVDTCVLADILRQYDPMNPRKEIECSHFISTNIQRVLNSIISDENSDKYVIASVFAFIELMNKFNDIFIDHEISLERLNSILVQPPEWLIIENMDLQTAKSFCYVPILNKIGERISSDDAVHIATALQRGDKLYLLTSDSKLDKLELDNITFVR